MRNFSQRAFSSTSPIAQGVLDQTQMIYQGARRNAMQVYITFNAFYERKAQASQLKGAD